MSDNHKISREFREKQIWAVRFRCGVLVGLVAIYMILVAFGGVAFNAYALAALTPLFLLNEGRRRCHRRGIHSDTLTELSIVSDMATIGLIIHFTGGVESIFIPFLFIQVAGTALHVNFRAGLKSAVGGAMLFSLLTWLEWSEVVPHSQFLSSVGHKAHCLNTAYFLSASVMVGFCLLLTSLSSGYVARKLRVREDELAEANRKLVRLYRETQRLSITDELTGAFNRRHLSQRLEEELSRSGRYERKLSLLILDVDHFKKVNDNYGHPVGDAVLKEVSARVSRVLRDVDYMARYGGEEFVVLLPETDTSGAQLVADRIRMQICGEPIRVDGSKLSVTASLGVASHPAFGENRPDPAADLLAAADARLYRAKKAGRNRVVCTDQPQDAAAATTSPGLDATAGSLVHA